MEALHVPWPVQKWFNNDHERGRSKPGCREVGSSTVAQLVTEADCLSDTTTVSSYLQETDPTRWDAVMKIAEMGD